MVTTNMPTITAAAVMFTADGQPENWTSGATTADVAKEYSSPELCATLT
ncbi:hypothetical protein ACFV4X_07765 [Streptomyces ardesiacus]